MIEVEEGVFLHDYSQCFRDNNILNLEIDLSRPKEAILQHISLYIDFFKPYVKTSKSRKKSDQKINRFEIWDEYKRCHDFAEISKKYKIDQSTVRKAYLRAFRDIMGEEYDPDRHNRKAIKKVELKKTCDCCAQRTSCGTLCPDVLSFYIQDEVKQKERPLSDLPLPPSI